jgi:hypothetical protein
MLAVYALGRGLCNALKQQYNNANASNVCEIVLCGSFDNSASLVLLLVLRESTVNCLCLIYSY